MLDSDSTTLIEAARQGDTEAMEALLLQYQPTISKFARKYCATPQDVEDAVQEALWIAARKIGALRTTTVFVAWLFRIVRNQCYRLLRIRQEVSDIDLDTRLIAFEGDPEQQASLHLDLVAALAALPTTYREVVLMRDVQELSAPEVAAKLGISVDAVKARLQRARGQLRASLIQWSR